MTLTVLKHTGQIFCRISEFDVFLNVKLWLWVIRRKTTDRVSFKKKFIEVWLIHNVVFNFNKVTQLHTHTCIILFIFFSTMVYHKVLTIIPCTIL